VRKTPKESKREGKRNEQTATGGLALKGVLRFRTYYPTPWGGEPRKPSSKTVQEARGEVQYGGIAIPFSVVETRTGVGR